MRKIGILEDDEALGRELTYFLTSNGYDARLIAPSEYEGMRADELIMLLMDENLHLLLLDIGLPWMVFISVSSLEQPQRYRLL